MTLDKLAKAYDFSEDWQYLQYIIDSYINGNNTQCKELFKQLQPTDKDYFLNEFLEMNEGTGQLKQFLIQSLIY